MSNTDSFSVAPKKKGVVRNHLPFLFKDEDQTPLLGDYNDLYGYGSYNPLTDNSQEVVNRLTGYETDEDSEPPKKWWQCLCCIPEKVQKKKENSQAIPFIITDEDEENSQENRFFIPSDDEIEDL